MSESETKREVKVGDLVWSRDGEFMVCGVVLRVNPDMVGGMLLSENDGNIKLLSSQVWMARLTDDMLVVPQPEVTR